MVMLANVTLGPYTVNNQAIRTSAADLFAAHVLISTVFRCRAECRSFSRYDQRADWAVNVSAAQLYFAHI